MRQAYKLKRNDGERLLVYLGKNERIVLKCTAEE
jgi:hypothetical protein